jgi:hypothetical protein
MIHGPTQEIIMSTGNVYSRVPTVIAAVLGLGIAYAMAVTIYPATGITDGNVLHTPGMQAAANAESIDNSRECDARAGITSACVY